jgi:hypothetical protein
MRTGRRRVAVARAPSSTGGVLDLPYALRLGAGAILAIVAGRRGGRLGEVGLVVAITVANPTLWANALSILVAVVPLWRTAPREAARDLEHDVRSPQAVSRSPMTGR